MARGAAFSWQTSKPPTLADVNISLHAAEFVCVTGKVGAGKSSFLLGLLGEMKTTAGTVIFHPSLAAAAGLGGGIGYVAQEPFIQNASMRDNILFGRDMDQQYYNTVLAACALDRDLALLPVGDLTEIGENGTNLSGGQKARLCLARAAYQRCKVYFLDDPLAALDAHVAAQVLSACICGLMAGSLRVLCTHNRQAVALAGRVLEVVEGSVIQVSKDVAVLAAPAQEDDIIADPPVDADEEAMVTEEPSLVAKALMSEEERDIGVLDSAVYRTYWHAVGTALAITVLLSMLLMQASRNLSDWWLAYWVSHSDPNHNATWDPLRPPIHDSSSGTLFLEIYGGISASNAVFTLFRSFLFAYAGVRAARCMQQGMLKGVMGATLRFFQTTPIGRLVNRFSSDVYGVDDSLPFIMNIFFAQGFGLVGSIAVSCYGLPYFAIVLLPLGCIYYYVQRYYRQTSREVKRLGSISRSPMYAHFTETLTGVATVRAFRSGARFLTANVGRLHDNQVAVYTEQSVSQWLSIRLQLIGVIMVTSVSFIAAAEHHLSHVDAGLVGLAISYALSITGLLQGR